MRSCGLLQPPESVDTVGMEIVDRSSRVAVADAPRHGTEWARLEKLGFVTVSLEAIDKGRLCRYQEYADAESYRRIHFRPALALINYDLGWPIIVADDDGEPIRQPFCSLCDESSNSAIDAALLEKVQALYLGPVEQRASSVHCYGVFATSPLRRGEFIGCYSGTVRTEEQWESEHLDSDYCVIVNDGANGVVIDGEHGAVNVLKSLNHSCEPNCNMRFQFFDGCWHALLNTNRCICVVSCLKLPFKLLRHHIIVSRLTLILRPWITG